MSGQATTDAACGLRCPECGGGNITCFDSRPRMITNTRIRLAAVIYRRKRCRDCGARMTTYELTSEALHDLMGRAVKAEVAGLEHAISVLCEAVAKERT